MEQLPSAFLARMKDMLGEEYSAYVQALFGSQNVLFHERPHQDHERGR